MKKSIESKNFELTFAVNVGDKEKYISDLCVKIRIFTNYDSVSVEITDLANAAKVGKSCTAWTIEQKHDPRESFLDMPEMFAAVCGSSEISKIVENLRRGDFSETSADGNITVYSRERKGVDTFSPFAKVNPVKVPSKWTMSHVWKAIYSGQIVAAHRDYRYTDDYAYDAAYNFGERDLSGDDLADLAEDIIEGNYSGWLVRCDGIDENGNYIISLALHSFEGWTLAFNPSSTCGIVETRKNLGVDDDEKSLTLVADFSNSEPTDPDDPTPGKPENIENDTAYSKFDSFFNSCNIISVTFGGTQNSAEALTEKMQLEEIGKINRERVNKMAKRKKLTEKEWKRQLEEKAAFEAAEGKRQLEEIAEKLKKGVKLIDGQTIKKIDKYDEENNTLDVESWLVYTVEGCCYDVFDFCDGVTGFDEVSKPEQPLENQISFDDVAYSKNEQPEQAAAVSPINEELARWAHESHSFSDYKTGSATAGYNAQVAEVAELAEKVKSSAPEEFHSEIDSLVSRYASRLAEWTNRRNRIENSCPSWFVSGPANYPMRKFEKQQAALKNCYDDLEKIEHIKARIKNFANRPIMSGDESAIDRLTEKVENLRKEREEMKQENAEARKAGKTAPYGSYTLSNSLANLRTAEKRLEELKKAKETPTAAADDLKNGFCEVIRNTDIMRLQLIFSGKPDDETRNILKSNGFKWAPSQKAWQRQLNNNAVYAAKRVFSSLAELTAKS